MNSARIIALLLLTLSPPTVSFSQTSAGALPKKPTELLTLAHEENGLTGDGLKPWHIRGNYHWYIEGKLDYEGVYEEWWFSPTQYKLSFTTPKFAQTDYATGNALLRDGVQDWLTEPEMLLRTSLVDPLPSPSQLADFALIRTDQTVGKGKIECVSLTYPVGPNVRVTGDFYPMTCFEPSMPALRIFAHGSLRVIYDQLVLFQGHYLARQIQISLNGKLLADLNIDSVETLKQPAEALLSPPSTATAVDSGKIVLKESKILWPVLLKKVVPVYPEQAKPGHIRGTVNLRATIGIDGRVQEAQAVDGPPALRQASIDAVRQWVYRPAQVMGQPRPVEVEIHVKFSLD